jgi:L-ascorbate metabolism protein UlaG (beta-lactamase superfamily)
MIVTCLGGAYTASGVGLTGRRRLSGWCGVEFAQFEAAMRLLAGERRRLRMERLESRHMLAALPAVAGAYLIYNNSAFDGADPAANAADDAAIATDKMPLAPGAAPSFANYSSYAKGINALAIDVANLGAPVTQDSFTFKVGNTSTPHLWEAAPAPVGFALRSGAGFGGSDRATWLWADGAIVNTWLQVTFNDTGAVFYFGNSPGETGNSTGNAFVSAADELGVRGHAGAAAIDSAFDFNRDGSVDAADELVARGNRRLLSNSLRLIDTPALNLVVISDSLTIGLAGEVVHYRYAAANMGNTDLTGVNLTASGGLAGASAPVRQSDLSGDGDIVLEPGEIWLYTSMATVSQAALNAGAEIVRTAAVETDQTSALKAVTGSTVAATTGDVFGELLIRPITHASLLMTYRGKTIYVDPDAPTSLYTGLPRADYILITHSHGDHFDTAAIAAIANMNTSDAIPDVRIVAPQAVFNSMSATMRSFTTVIDHLPASAPPESLSFLDEALTALFSVQAVPAYNGNHPLGAGNGYVVTIDDKRIYFSGDTGAQPELRALEDIDIAFVAMNTPFTMTPAEAVSFVRDFEPLVVYPYHYRNSDGSLGNAVTFKNLMSTDFDIEVRLRKWY